MSTNLAYQDDFQEECREELIDGQAVAMSPRPVVNHTRISGRILTIFENFLRGKTCVPLGDGVDLFLTDRDRFVPDGMIVCDRSKIKPKGVYGAPDLVVEVLSPRTARYDRGYKKRVYESCGVAEYWIVDPVSKNIEVYLLRDGHYFLDNIYYYYTEEDIAEMDEEEKAAAVTEFKCHLYDDLLIRLDDIFGDLF